MKLPLSALMLFTGLILWLLPGSLMAQDADRLPPFSRVVQSDDFEGFGYAENALILDWGRSIFDPKVFDDYQPYPQVVEDGLIIAPLKLGYATAQVWVPIQGPGPHTLSYDFALCDAEGAPIPWDTIEDPEFMLDYAVGWVAAETEGLIPEAPEVLPEGGIGHRYWHIAHDADLSLAQAEGFDNTGGLLELPGLALANLEPWVPVSMHIRKGKTDFSVNGEEWTGLSVADESTQAYYAVLFFWIETSDGWQNSPVTLRLRHLQVE